MTARHDGMPLFYRSDGTGRDSYIVKNNGGLYSQNLLRSIEYAGERKNEYSPLKLGLSPRQKTLLQNSGDRFVHYHSDGSGRDSYVGCNHGGRINNFNSISPEKKFQSILRSYERMPNLPSPSNASYQSNGLDFHSSKVHLTGKQFQLQNIIHTKQNIDSYRLSKPKRVASPLKLPSIVSPRSGTIQSLFSSQAEKNLKQLA